MLYCKHRYQYRLAPGQLLSHLVQELMGNQAAHHCQCCRSVAALCRLVFRLKLQAPQLSIAKHGREVSPRCTFAHAGILFIGRDHLIKYDLKYFNTVQKDQRVDGQRTARLA
ncbi:hypothetical protein IPC3_25465 [Pseudomonas aeruginosa]|nr:hypothetical protein IPC1038_23540 [Pseudomonas aeruginosa]RQJ37995.1 hypothetical protein IPC3_25465 [Pseudomonas aeruginosa]